MALNRKYAALPDLDSAPDIYETPELTDDTSTLPGTTIHTRSDDELSSNPDDEGFGISRSRLRINEARSRFLPAHVDASEVDFSDRVDSKRRSYKTASRRERVLADGTRELGDLSDDDDDQDDEGLERRLARLRREVEEVKQLYANRRAAPSTPEQGEGAADEGREERLESISSILEEMARAEGVDQRIKPRISQPEMTPDEMQAMKNGALLAEQGATYTVTYAPTYEQNHALAKAADFDRRLVLLEKALGIGSSAMSDADVNTPPRAIIPALDVLLKQISVLSEASTASLDTTTRRVRTLAQEITQLNEARTRAETALPPKVTPAEQTDRSDQTAKIHALYGTLPTIESLAPLLPPLLDRLRSLREVHAEAGAAAGILADIETRQAEMAAEIAMWREGLEKVEARTVEGADATRENREVVDGWVKGLEARMAKLGA